MESNQDHDIVVLLLALACWFLTTSSTHTPSHVEELERWVVGAAGLNPIFPLA